MSWSQRFELAGAVLSAVMMFAVFPLHWNPAFMILFYGGFAACGVMLNERRNGHSVWERDERH